jgi:hypothetical protein
MSELPAPPDAAAGTELLRAWVIGQALYCALCTDAFEDPATWGTVLAYVARNVAAALAEQEGRDGVEAVRLIRAAFDADLDAPPQA